MCKRWLTTLLAVTALGVLPALAPALPYHTIVVDGVKDDDDEGKVRRLKMTGQVTESSEEEQPATVPPDEQSSKEETVSE